MREKVNDAKWIGQKYGRLTVTGFFHKGEKWYWECACECGNSIITQAHLVRNGHTSSGGCLQRERASEASLVHGQSNSRLYRIYNGMKNRCYNQKQQNYENYGGRGITICEEWLKSFTSFEEWALSHGYADDLSIDRIDSNGDYSPENCRWVTRTEQNENTRSNHLVTIGDRTQPLSAWVRERGLNYHTVSFRIHQKHMTPEQALEVNESE